MLNRPKTNKSRVAKAARRPVVRLLILGGARSGKSRLAQDMAARRWLHPVYLATAEILDDEMAARVRMHRRTRARRWHCVEEPLEIARIIRRGVPGTDGILVDCLTIWFSNVLLKEGRSAFARRRVFCTSAEITRTACSSPASLIISGRNSFNSLNAASRCGEVWSME